MEQVQLVFREATTTAGLLVKGWRPEAGDNHGGSGPGLVPLSLLFCFYKLWLGKHSL